MLQNSYFEELINNGCNPTALGVPRNPYQVLMNIFNDEQQKSFLTEKMNAADKVAHQNLLQKNTGNNQSISTQEPYLEIVNKLSS